MFSQNFSEFLKKSNQNFYEIFYKIKYPIPESIFLKFLQNI